MPWEADDKQTEPFRVFTCHAMQLLYCFCHNLVYKLNRMFIHIQGQIRWKSTICKIQVRSLTEITVNLMIDLIVYCHIMLHYVTSCYIMSHHVTLCHIMLHHVTSCYIMLHHVTSCYIMSHHVTFCYIFKWQTIFSTTCTYMKKINVKLSTKSLIMWFISSSLKPYH